MAYQSINNSPAVQTSPDEPTRSGNACLSCWCWFIQIAVWASICGLVVGIISETKEGYYACYAFLFCYIVYLITEFCSPTFSYLRHQKDNNRMYDKMGELFRTAPTITFTAQCYHYETRHHTSKDANGHVQHSTERVRINTHYDKMIMPYYSARDVSGLFLLDIGKASSIQKAFIKLHLQKEINFADPISYSDYLFHKEAFWQRNRYRDVHMDFHEFRDIPGFHTHNLVQIGDYHPAGVSVGLYVLCTLLTVCQFYKRYVDSFCVFQNYKIRKLISTRYNLLLPDYVQQYAPITPALNLTGSVMTYDSQNVGYCSSDYQVNVPTQEELDKAKQYENMIPHYGFSSVGGDAQIGVVQDLPNFAECNYDQPPPSFTSLGGDVALSDSQINSTGNNGFSGSDVNMNVNTNMNQNMQVNTNMNQNMNMNPQMNPNMNINMMGNPNMNVNMMGNPNMNMQYNMQSGYQPPMQGGFQG